MKLPRQADLFANDTDHRPRRYTHGGDTSKGKRKLSRPLDRRKPAHLTLKSTKAKGPLNFRSPRNKLYIERVVEKWARKLGITIHAQQNVGNHIHLIVSFPRREAVQNFMRTVAGLIARHVTGAKKGRPFGERFWDALAFSRVVHGERDLWNLKRYILKNEVEAEFGGSARDGVERFDEADRKARKTGRPITDFL